MTNIRRAFNKEIKQIAKENGFQKLAVPYDAELYVRTTDELLQTFQLQKYSSGDCDIYFSSSLIRGKITKFHFLAPVYPLSLVKIYQENYSNFSYDRNDEESIIECAKKITLLFQKHILPFFDSVQTSYQLFSALSEVYKDHTSPWWLLNGTALNLALNIKETSLAINICTSLKLHCEEALRREKTYSFEKRQEIQKEIEEYKKYIHMLTIGNYEYFEKMLDKFEEEARIFINQNLTEDGSKPLKKSEKSNLTGNLTGDGSLSDFNS